METLFKKGKRCYNVLMKDRKQQQNEGFFSALIGEKTSAKTAGLTYTVAALAIFAVSFVLAFFAPLEVEEGYPDWWLYVSFLASPIAFLLVGVWYFSYAQTSIKSFIKEQKCPWRYYLLALILQIGLLSLSELNGLFIKFLEKFGYEATVPELPSMQGFGFVGVLFVAAVLPAVMEEFVFRGIFLRETKGFSLLARVLICGGFFSLYHQNPAQTIYQFICGVAFALVAIKAGSILPTVLSHFINNALIVTLEKCGVNSFSSTVYVICLVASGLCLLASFLWLLVFDRKRGEKKKGAYGPFFSCAALGIIMMALSWLTMLLVEF